MKKSKYKYYCTCCRDYFQPKNMSEHHIWPKHWYHGAGPTAKCCVFCHRQFEKENPHTFVWTTKEAEEKWRKFVLKKNIEYAKRF